jgi:hypothetical protein
VRAGGLALPQGPEHPDLHLFDSLKIPKVDVAKALEMKRKVKQVGRTLTLSPTLRK